MTTNTPPVDETDDSESAGLADVASATPINNPATWMNTARRTSRTFSTDAGIPPGLALEQRYADDAPRGSPSQGLAPFGFRSPCERRRRPHDLLRLFPLPPQLVPPPRCGCLPAQSEFCALASFDTHVPNAFFLLAFVPYLVLKASML